MVTPMSLSDAGFGKGELPMTGDERLALFAAERTILPSRMLDAISEDLSQQGLDELYADLEEPLIPGANGALRVR